MLWFKEWYREKFVNPFEKNAITIFKENEKSTEPKLSDRKNVTSVLRQPHHYLRKRNKSKRSIIENIFDNRRNNNDRDVAVYSTLTNVSTKIEVVDNATSQVISETQRVNIDTSIRIFNFENEFYSDSSVTDVNQYGNGESGCDLLSKSKDSRLHCQTKSTVGTIKLELSERFISEIVPAFNELSIIHSDSSEWLTSQSETNYHQKPFLHQTRDPKNFKIDRSTNKSDLNLLKRITNQYRTCNEHQFDDWAIVSIDDDCISYLNETESSVQYYTTCECSGIDKQLMVTVHHWPLMYSSKNTDSHESDTLGPKWTEYYGITCSHSRGLQLLLWLSGIFDFCIKTGAPFNDFYATSFNGTASFIKMNCYTKNIANIKSSDYLGSFLKSESIRGSETMSSDFNFRSQEPCSCKKQFNLFLGHNEFSPIPTTDHTPESIPEYFGLSDQGDIIINIDHISEEKGYGFMMRRKKEIYRKVPYGEEVCEKDFFHFGSIKKMFKSFSDKICKCYRGE